MLRNLIVVTGLYACIACFTISASEAQQGNGNRLAKRFDRVDRNKDGVVERQELERGLQRRFERADRNNDGVVDRDEVKALSERRGAKARKSGGKGGARIEKQFQKADADRDGRVTRSEYLDKLPAWYRRADEDRDGRVTRAELDNYAANRTTKKGKRNRKEQM